MKKTLIALSIAALMTMPVFAHDFVVEPESDTSVSYAAYDILSGEWETTFVNYCNSNGDDEYWLRLAFRGDREKVLHYCTLYVDGESYRLSAVPFDDKHFYAAQSITDIRSDVGRGRLLATQPRYYGIPRELADKIRVAKEIKLKVDRVGRINTELTVNNKMLDDIHLAYGLRYADFSNYWKPNDTAAEKQK